MQFKHGSAPLSNRFQPLRERIARLRIPQHRLSDLTGLDESTISRAFNGKTDPLMSTIERIEKAVAAEEAATAEYLAGRPSKGAAA